MAAGLPQDYQDTAGGADNPGPAQASPQDQAENATTQGGPDPNNTEENREKLAQYGVFKGPEGYYNKNGQPMKDENGEPITTTEGAMKALNKEYPGAFPEAAAPDTNAAAPGSVPS